MSTSTCSHLDAEGIARMVDVGAKPIQRRRATAEGGIALAAVSVAALTIYDRCKAIDNGMIIGAIGVVEKIKQ